MEKHNYIQRKNRFLCILLILVLAISGCSGKKPRVPSDSVQKNCEVVHDIYMNREKKDSYNTETLYNFGLCSTKTNTEWHSDIEDKKWNGTWIVTEDFIKQYVEKYSAAEFLEVYFLYVASYIDPVVNPVHIHGSDYYFMDEKFYNQNPELLKYITETTTTMLNLTDSFDVVHYCPSTDQLLNKTSETETVTGKFNVGKDNHIETKTANLVTDTYEYDGYIVEHVYGKRYSQGEYGWKNGDFVDVPASFYSVDEYSLYVKGLGTIASGNSLEDLECKWIKIGDTEFYLRRIDGINYKFANPEYNYADPKIFSPSVFVLTKSASDASEHYVVYP